MSTKEFGPVSLFIWLFDDSSLLIPSHRAANHPPRCRSPALSIFPLTHRQLIRRVLMRLYRTLCILLSFGLLRLYLLTVVFIWMLGFLPPLCQVVSHLVVEHSWLPELHDACNTTLVRVPFMWRLDDRDWLGLVNEGSMDVVSVELGSRQLGVVAISIW